MVPSSPPSAVTSKKKIVYSVPGIAVSWLPFVTDLHYKYGFFILFVLLSFDVTIICTDTDSDTEYILHKMTRAEMHSIEKLKTKKNPENRKFTFFTIQIDFPPLCSNIEYGRSRS